MPSSRSSLDKRDIYYRLHKSAGYRARSAYKLIHLDEEFDLFTGVETVVDLCAAPGSWSQVVGERLGPRLASGQAKLVSLDLQPMAPLRHTTTLQADLTTPCTIPLVLSHLDNRKADLVICDGAPDVTGVHDLDAYLHHQLLMAAFTLTLAILQKGGTAVYKIFLSPLDPHAAGLREQVRVFFPGEEDEGGWFEEYDQEEDGDEEGAKKGFGKDMEGRRGGVWVRKPRSSRKGSGGESEAFLICRNYDPSTVPLPLTFSPTALEALAQQTTGTLTLDSLAHLAGTDVKLSPEQARRWEVLKGLVGRGDLNPMSALTSSTKTPDSKRDALKIDTLEAPPLTPPAPSSPTITHTEPTPGASTSGRTGPLSLTLPSMSHLSPPRSTPSYAQHRRNRSSIDSGSPSSPTSAAWAGGWGGLGPSPLPSPVSPYPPNLPTDETGRASISGLSRSSSIKHEPYALSRYVDPPQQQPRPDSDGMISPALSTSSKTDIFFASSQIDFLPTPPRPLSGSSSTAPGGSSGAGSLGRAGSLGKGWPGRSLLSQSITSQADLGGPGKSGERDRASTMPTTPVNGGATPTRPGDDGWALSPKALEAVSAPSVSQNVGIGIGIGVGHTRDRRLSGTGRVASLSGSDTLGLVRHSRERSDSAASSINPGDRILTSPLTGLPSGDSIRALANLVGTNATSSALVPPPTISRAQLTKSWARRESLIEREEHRTQEHQEGGLQPGEVLIPVEKEELGRMEEEGEEWFPGGERREEVMGSFSGAWPGSSRENGTGAGIKRRWRLEKKLGEGAFSAVWGARAEVDDDSPAPQSSSLAAIKLLPRQLTASNDRTRISFLREVGVLSRLSHPHIVGFIDDFETRTYFCLALERVEGGELFEIIQDKKWVGVLRECKGSGARAEWGGEKSEAVDGEVLVRRVFSELVRATTFLHACGVVHRDIKLENILLTVNPLIHLASQPTTSDLLSALPPISNPLIKLTDFGLSRFISPSSPLLTTRCGSESFAAPEIIMGKPYDGRDTDSWACGVVLYATITGELPFDTGSTSPTAPTGSGFSIGADSEKEERRRRMLKIAKGAYSWPSGMGSEGARKVVARLLVRDPRKRARVADLWDEEWMRGTGSVGPERDQEGDLEDGKKRVKGGWVIQGRQGDEMVTEGGF